MANGRFSFPSLRPSTRKMSSTVCLALPFFIYAQLLPILFLFHILGLCATAIWTGIPLALTIQGITIENDICLPHPPGFFDSRPERDQNHEATIDHDLYARSASPSDDSFLSVTQDVTFAVPLVVSEPTNSQLKETNILDNLTLSDIDVTLWDPVANIMDFSSKKDSFTALYSSSDKIYILDSLEPSDSTMSLDITDQYLGFTEDSYQEPTSPSRPIIHFFEAPEEFDLTEEAIIKQFTNHNYVSPPTSRPDIVIPRASNDSPIFSRHNINDNVIFPVRKSPRSFSFSEGIVKEAAATLTKTMEELKNSSSRPPVSSRLSMTSTFSLFNSEEAKPVVSVRDPYDSWPFIRSEIEDGIAEAEGEKDSIGSVINAALNFSKF